MKCILQKIVQIFPNVTGQLLLFFSAISQHSHQIALTLVVSNNQQRHPQSTPVLAFLAIYRQIRDFGRRHGDENLALAIDRQSLKFRDFEPWKSAKLAKFEKQWRIWRFMMRISKFLEWILTICFTNIF